MKRNIKYNGLTERPHYASIVDYLENEHPKTTYPFDRTATILRNSPYMTKLDGEIGIDLQDFENRLEKDKLREITLREQAARTGLTVSEATAIEKTKRGPIIHDLLAKDLFAEEEEAEEMIEETRTREKKRKESMPPLVAAYGLPDPTKVDYLTTENTTSEEEKGPSSSTGRRFTFPRDIKHYEKMKRPEMIKILKEIGESKNFNKPYIEEAEIRNLLFDKLNIKYKPIKQMTPITPITPPRGRPIGKKGSYTRSQPTPP
jgi:hypothetical protein